METTIKMEEIEGTTRKGVFYYGELKVEFEIRYPELRIFTKTIPEEVVAILIKKLLEKEILVKLHGYLICRGADVEKILDKIFSEGTLQKDGGESTRGEVVRFPDGKTATA